MEINLPSSKEEKLNTYEMDNKEFILRFLDSQEKYLKKIGINIFIQEKEVVYYHKFADNSMNDDFPLSYIALSLYLNKPHFVDEHLDRLKEIIYTKHEAYKYFKREVQ